MRKALNIINFGFDPWSDFWKRNQTMVYLMAEREIFDRALFVNSEIWLGGLLTSAAEELRVHKAFRLRRMIPSKVSGKIAAYTPTYLPFSGRSERIDSVSRYIFNSIASTYASRPFLLIINNSQESTMKLVESIRDRAVLTIFDWSDDFSEFSSNPAQRKKTEEICSYCCKISDIVICINEKLLEKAKKIHDNAYVIRNATNVFTFSSGDMKARIPPALMTLKRPIIGYVGYLNGSRLDKELIDFLALCRPEWQFVFMGPRSEPLPLGTRVPARHNVHILPPVPYRSYPACLSAFDVCILPNRINAYTAGNDPIKIYDYLACGTPVVATPTSGTERFRGLIPCSESKEGFLELLDAAIEKKDSIDRKKMRQEAAMEHSWQERIKELFKIIDPRLGKGQMI
jgi:glycosyltransferase involved in cell wall biosynthesis